MTARLTLPKLFLILVVFAAFLISELAVTFEHHDPGYPPLNECPTCAASHVLSFADYSLPSLAFVPVSCLITFLLPFERCLPQHPIYLSYLNNRAPPHALSS